MSITRVLTLTQALSTDKKQCALVGKVLQGRSVCLSINGILFRSCSDVPVPEIIVVFEELSHPSNYIGTCLRICCTAMQVAERGGGGGTFHSVPGRPPELTLFQADSRHYPDELLGARCHLFGGGTRRLRDQSRRNFE